MTKEELVKEAEEWLCNNLHSASEEDFIKAMVDFAEPREKRIEVLEELLDKCGNSIKELEAQIEKMKCCENCAWWYKLPNGQRDCAETCENRDNWSLRR